jgi:hypothetical protein
MASDAYAYHYHKDGYAISAVAGAVFKKQAFQS